MLIRVLLGLSFLLLCGSGVQGQCSCGDKNCGALAIGSDYTQVSADESGADCGDSQPKFDCFGTCDRDCTLLSRCHYASFFGGWNGAEEFETANDIPDGDDFNLGSLQDGEVYGVAIGSQVHPKFRYELEAAYRQNDPESWSVLQFSNGVITSSVIQPATGRLQTYSGMVNFMLDFSPRQVGCWQGYTGIGVGGAAVDGNFVTATNTYQIDDSSIAWQVIGGLSRAVTRRFDAYIEYRYFSAGKVTVFDATNSVSLGDFHLKNSSVLAGLRLRF